MMSICIALPGDLNSPRLSPRRHKRTQKISYPADWRALKAVRTGLAIHTNANACPVTSGISLIHLYSPALWVEIHQKQLMLGVIRVKDDAVIPGSRHPAC